MKKLSESDLLLWRQTNKDNPSEYEEMTRNLEAPTPATLPREILKKLANKRLPTDATLDLHGYDRISAREQVIKFIKCYQSLIIIPINNMNFLTKISENLRISSTTLLTEISFQTNFSAFVYKSEQNS